MDSFDEVCRMHVLEAVCCKQYRRGSQTKSLLYNNEAKLLLPAEAGIK